jgi:hypothetical protein
VSTSTANCRNGQQHTAKHSVGSTMPLTDTQQTQLNAAILDYMSSKGMEAATAAFQAEAGLPGDALADGSVSGLLEKKWTAVIRLQKKVLELESQLVSNRARCWHVKCLRPAFARPMHNR